MAYDTFLDVALNAYISGQTWDNGTNAWSTSTTTSFRGDGNGSVKGDGALNVFANFNRVDGQNGAAIFFTVLPGRTTGTTLFGMYVNANGSLNSAAPTSGVYVQVGVGSNMVFRGVAEGVNTTVSAPLVDNNQYCLEVYKTSDPSNLQYRATLYNASGNVRGSQINSALVTLNSVLPDTQKRVAINSTQQPYFSVQRVESYPLDPIAAPTATITSQPAPNGQSQTINGTYTGATSATYTLIGSGVPNVGPTAFALSGSPFSVTPTGIPAGTYTPRLIFNGDGGSVTVDGTSFTIIGATMNTSLPDTGSIPATAPSAPSNVIATAGDGVVTVTGTAGFDGGSPVTSWEVLASTGQTASASTLPINITMPNGIAATFQLRAVNSVGAGAWSTASNSVTPQAVATVPAAPTVVATAGDNSISVTVTPGSNGGSEIVSHTVTLSTGEAQTASGTVFVFTGLSTLTRTATAYSTNAVGDGPSSAPSNSVTPTQAATAPAAPAAPTATVGPGHGALTLTCTPPADGGSAIIEYLGELSTGETSSSTTPTITFTGLSNVARTGRMQARNNVGTSAYSPDSNSVTPTVAPGEVTGITIIPQVASLAGEATFQFTSVVQGTNNPSQEVIYSCSGGTISADGLYLAPAATIVPQQHIVTVTSEGNPNFSANAIVNIAAIGEEVVSGTPLRHYVSNITNKFGVAIEGAFVTVIDNATGEKAALWKDKEKTMTLDNPIVTDDEGLVDFYVEAQQCSYHVKGPEITPYTREDIFDIIQNVDLSPITRALLALSTSKVSAAELQTTIAPLATKSEMGVLQADLDDVVAQLPDISSYAPVDVHRNVTGGTGTISNPWTGWDTATTWGPNTQYDFRDGYYAYTTSPNFAHNFLRLNTRTNTVFVHTGNGVAFNVDAGASASAIVVGLDIRARVKSHAGAQQGMLMRGVAQSKIKVEFNDVPNVCVQELSCILNDCEYSTSPTQRGRTFAAATLLSTGRRGSGLGCAGNKYKLLAENLTDIGVLLDYCTDSQFEGASQYNDIGVQSTSNCARNSFRNFITNKNTTEDFRWFGDDCSFTDMLVGGTATFGGKRARVVGGVYDSINAYGSGSHFANLSYGSNQGRFNEGVTPVTRQNLYNSGKLAFELDQGQTVDNLNVRGRAIFGTDTFMVGDGQIVKNPAGQVMFGTSAPNGAARFQLFNPLNTATDINFRSTMMDNAYVATAFHAVFQTGGSEVFRVSGVGNVTNVNNSYGAISDERLKENVVNATPKLDLLRQVRVVNYNLISDPNKEKLLGVLAGELEQLFPGMVEVDAQGYKTVKYSVFGPMMLKALQELADRVDAL